eukprot:Opistho-2@39466
MSAHFPAVRPDAAPATSVAASAEGPFELHDTMRFGLHHTITDIAPKHPIEVIQERFDSNSDALRLAMLGKVQGSQAVMRMRMERNILSSVGGRMPGMDSNRLGLETINGTDTLLAGFEDILNDPREALSMGAPHDMMEARLGMRFSR